MSSGPPSTNPPDLHVAAASSVRVALLSQHVVQLLSLIAISVQMRLVPRADFAIFGLAVLLVEFPRMLTTMGVGAAVIQRPHIRSDELNFLFWLNQFFGLMAMAASVIAAMLFTQPGDAAGLLPVTAVLATSSLFAAVARVPQAVLERELRVGEIARGQWISMGIASAVSIAMGIAGLNIWALVAHQWLEVALFSLVLWPKITWRPSRPTWAGYSRDLFHYANAFTISQWIHWLGQRFDRYWLWSLLASSPLGLEWIGLYTQTMNLILRPALMITGPLTGVLLSALSRSAGDESAIRPLFRSIQRIAAIFLCPICFGLIATAEESLYFLGGEKWRHAAVLLVAMGTLMISRAAVNLAVIALSASGKPRLIVINAAASSLLLVIAACVATSATATNSHSPPAVTFAMAAGQSVVTAVLILMPTLWLCSYALKVPFLPLVLPWMKPLAVSALMALIVTGARFLPLPWQSIPTLVRFGMLAVIGAVFYSLIMLPDLKWVATFLRRGRFAIESPE